MEFIHTALNIASLGATETFYVEGLGLERRGSFESDGFEFVNYGGDGGAELQIKVDPTTQTAIEPAGIDHLSFAVDDVDVTVDRLRERTGCPVLQAPEPAGEDGPRIAFVEDPDGYAVELIEAAE